MTWKSNFIPKRTSARRRFYSWLRPCWSLISRSLNSANAWLNATIDAFRIYAGRLTPQEIAVDHQFGPGVLALPVTIQQSNEPTTTTLPRLSRAIGFQLEATTELAVNSRLPADVPPPLAADRWTVSFPRTNVPKMFRLKR